MKKSNPKTKPLDLKKLFKALYELKAYREKTACTACGEKLSEHYFGYCIKRK